MRYTCATCVLIGCIIPICRVVPYTVPDWTQLYLAVLNCTQLYPAMYSTELNSTEVLVKVTEIVYAIYQYSTLLGFFFPAF